MKIQGDERAAGRLGRTASLLALLAVMTGSGLLPANLCAAGGAKDEKVSLGQKTLAGPAPVWVICSYDAEGKPNAMTASWAGICSSNPASVTVSLREARYSYGNIVGRKAFTVNIPSSRFAAETAFFGTVSGRDIDKFKATGMTAVRSDLVDAPYIMEFPLVLECRLTGTYNVGGHVMFIGEIVDVKADRSVLDGRGMPDIGKLDPFVYSTGSGEFYSIGKSLGSIADLEEKISR